MLFLLLLVGLPLVSSDCIQCASPGLQNQWQLTGLAKQPSNLEFHSFCDDLGGDTFSESATVTVCATLCFEMVIPSENQYFFVRGCHDDFVMKGDSSQQAQAEKCLYTLVPNQRIAIGTKGTEYSPALAAVRFVKLTEGDELANDKLKRSGFDEDLAVKMQKKGCVVTQTVNCVKSIYYDGTGKDDNKDSCTGAFCTSVEGKLNGRKYVERGCAPISPYQDSACVEVRTNSTFYSGPGNGGTISRSKRSLDAILQGTQCFCTTEYCNTSARASFTVLLITVTLTSVIRFLY